MSDGVTAAKGSTATTALPGTVAAATAPASVVVSFPRRSPRWHAGDASGRPGLPAPLLLIDPVAVPPDASLLQHYPATDCLRDGVLPWRRVQGQTILLIDGAPPPAASIEALKTAFGRLRLARCATGAASTTLCRIAGPDLATAAETRCPEAQSCRRWNFRRARTVGIAILFGVATAAVLAPVALMAALVFWSCLTLICNTGLKVAAILVGLRPRRTQETPVHAPIPLHPPALPVVSILAPLYHEREIASHLLARLEELDYPQEKLDVLLILEDDDHLTHETLADLTLPPWARIVEVPEGTLRTKPRALNYALTLARGDIVGIYDAEDAPAPDQLRAVAQHFATAGPQVACLQGVLDYYNASSNWLARCFTLEYAMWFRLILPGLERLGLVVPLGGTTLFLRRAAIEAVGGWDAHNVTEDADLGLRLARAGYRTELMDSVTQEEANARLWPWVRQRTRWLKGYAMTWAVHMAHPVVLWREIGAWRFFGVQVLFLGTLSQFVLAPLLWSFWLLVLGLPHPLRGMLSEPAIFGLGALFLMTELINLSLATLAARRAGRPWLALWSPTLQVYFPLVTIAAWRALAELCARPFFWDKTLHGVFLRPAPPVAPAPPAPRD